MTLKKRVFLELMENEQFLHWLTAPDRESDAYWQQWIQENPDKVEVLREIKELFNSLEPRNSFDLAEGEEQEMLGQILDYAQRKKAQEEISEYSSRRSRSWGGWVFAAACVVFLALLLANYFRVFDQDLQPDFDPEVQWMTKTTVAGTKSTFYLPDGTLVKLNSSSTLEFPAVFSDSLRVVKLQGQGFFEVVRNESVPFIVQTEDMDIEVLGTSFDIQSYAHSEVLEVAVLTGKVSVVSSSGSKAVLEPGRKTSLNANTGEMKLSGYNPVYQFGWQEGILAFENLPVRSVLDELEKWYGVELVVDPRIGLDRLYTATYDNQSLENMLIGMSRILDFDFTIQDKQVNLTQK